MAKFMDDFKAYETKLIEFLENNEHLTLRECIEAFIQEQKNHVNRIRDEHIGIINKAIDQELERLNEKEGEKAEFNPQVQRSNQDVEIWLFFTSILSEG